MDFFQKLTVCFDELYSILFDLGEGVVRWQMGEFALQLFSKRYGWPFLKFHRSEALSKRHNLESNCFFYLSTSYHEKGKTYSYVKSNIKIES